MVFPSHNIENTELDTLRFRERYLLQYKRNINFKLVNFHVINYILNQIMRVSYGLCSMYNFPPFIQNTFIYTLSVPGDPCFSHGTYLRLFSALWSIHWTTCITMNFQHLKFCVKNRSQTPSHYQSHDSANFRNYLTCIITNTETFNTIYSRH
jgi:hypothetical protein